MICHCLFTKNSLFARNVIQKYSFFSIFHHEPPKKAHKANDFRKNPPVPYPYETKQPLSPSISHSLCAPHPVHHRFIFYGEQPLSGHRAAVERPCTVLQATVRGFCEGNKAAARDSCRCSCCFPLGNVFYAHGLRADRPHR